MQESYFGFNERPFAAAPRTASYVPAGNLETARQALLRCVQRAEGVGLVIGAAGTGKTLLCQLVADQLRYEGFHVALLASARLHTRRALLQNILFELNLPYRGLEDEELRLTLIDHLTPRNNDAGLVLIVDEAHTLPVRLLEEIRLISNFVRDGEPRVRLILAGGPPMEERLASPKLQSLAQRIAVRSYLQPLNCEQTSAYVRQQIQQVGGDPDLLAPPPVLRAVFHASDGIPRLINQICDHALLLAAEAGQRQLSERLVEEAWADLQQLPAPWHVSAKADLAAAPATTIEFGQLGDEAGENTVSLELPSVDAPTVIEAGKVAAATDVEPLPPGADDNPFGDGFEEEEVIIDRYASLEARALPDRAKVASHEGELLRAALGRHEESAQANSAAAEQQGEGGGERPAMRLVDVDAAEEFPVEDQGSAFNPADDPVLPEAADVEPQRFQPLPLDGHTDDDRGLIVVENARQRARELVVAPTQRRRKYRQLFNALRKS